jgi:ketosteroid isomerase-like protein
MKLIFRLASVFLLGLAAAFAAEPPPPPRAAVLALIEQQARAWETGDEAAFLATLHPDAVFAYPGKRLDRAGVLVTFRAWSRDFRDTKLRVHRVVIDGANFSVEYTFATTNVATGKRTAGGTVAVGEVRDGKLRVWKEYLDGRVSRAQAKDELPVDELAEPFPWPDTPESRQP